MDKPAPNETFEGTTQEPAAASDRDPGERGALPPGKQSTESTAPSSPNRWAAGVEGRRMKQEDIGLLVD